ncbi:hypothetical protein [Diaphorobacter limosus]|uniref:Uncharacterized protein n=1 Tax=Diaphorobacter limosus TaxID=3036128 RepID=A0ABZ0J2K5_9BURK|nr:hypothetical protein [Diaphorobacter sp. Y-1]WOO31586.1 hypothetical protein P4826_14370 [Diaphorobacter sp. Y-1]HRM93722.1 hypothetical protein [Alicycliphilus sp.]
MPCALLTLTACAPLASQQAEYPAGRARLALPAGAWEDLGTSDQAVRLLPQPDGRIALQSRVLGLRGAQQELLAVLRVQTNRGNDWQGPMFWTGSCLPQQGVAVEDATKGSRVRVDCLRFKRWVDGPQWLEKNQPDFARWLLGRKLAVSAPYSYMSYRYATEGGAMVAVDVLADQRLLRPRTRNNEEFLVAGRPALQWGHELAQAVRVSTGMMDGYLAIPPFPYAAAAP